MPRPNRNRNNQGRSSQTQNQTQNQSQNQSQNQNQRHASYFGQGQPFPSQDDENSIPFYNARLFAMYESLIQSYTHFTYHANHMYHVLEQALHGTRNSINSNPYPWLLIPHPQHQPQQPQQPQQHQPQQPQQHQPQQAPAQRAQQAQQAQQAQPRAPINRSNQRITTTLENEIVNAFLGMLYSPEERRLTQAELDERVDLVRFENIINPINTVCSITHDVFESAQQVARIRHCGHIFNPDSLAHWLRMNNTCPTCRHNLFTATTTTRAATSSDTRATTSSDTRAATSADTRATTSADTRAATSAAATADGSSAFRRIDIPLESEININTFYNELLQNSQNIPGFELNSVNDDSIIFSFDLMNNRLRSGITGPSASGPSASGPNTGPRNIDHVD